MIYNFYNEVIIIISSIVIVVINKIIIMFVFFFILFVRFFLFAQCGFIREAGLFSQSQTLWRAYWRGGIIGEVGLLERWVYWRGGFIGEAGLLERIRYIVGKYNISKA